MNENDVIELSTCYEAEGYDPTVARAFVRAEIDPPPLWRIRSAGFSSAEVAILEAEVKRRERAEDKEAT